MTLPQPSSSPLGLELVGVTKAFGDVAVLDAVNLVVRNGESLALLGPSGCGKTTTLRIIAGLERPDAGSVRIRGRDVSKVPPAQRDVAVVFQEGSLYPHMRVGRNIGYPLEVRGVPRTERQRRVESVAEQLGLRHLLNRFPGELSGGEIQRAALAKALAREADLWLLDEPFNSLDRQLRIGLRRDLRRLTRRLRPTVVLVTHDQDEAFTLGDRVAVMADGQVVQVDTPEGLLATPATAFVATFCGSPGMSLVPVHLEGELLQPSVPAGVGGFPLRALGAGARAESFPRDLLLGLRPDRVALQFACGLVPLLRGTIDVVEHLETRRLVHVDAGGVAVACSLPIQSSLVREGETVTIHVEPGASALFDPSGDRRRLWPPTSTT